MVRFLLKHGANPHAVDAQNLTPRAYLELSENKKIKNRKNMINLLKREEKSWRKKQDKKLKKIVTQSQAGE